MTVQKASPDQMEAVKLLWQQVFGDTPETIELICRSLSLEEHCFAAVENGKVTAAAFWYDCGELLVPGEEPRRAAVLYAASVEEAHRGQGLGQAVCRAAWDDMAQQGVEARFLVPAQPSLFRFYEKTLGAKTAFHVIRFALRSDLPGLLSRTVEAEEYGHLREAYLQGRAHIAFNPACLQLLQTLCERSGGGLYAYSNGCMALEMTEDGAAVKDQATAHFFLTRSQATSLVPGKTVLVQEQAGEQGTVLPYAMADVTIPPDGWFGFAFD